MVRQLSFRAVFKGFDGPESFALWLREQAGRPIRWEKVEPGGEQILPPREQREFDSLASGLDRETHGPPWLPGCTS